MPVAANQGTAKIVNRKDILPSPFRKAALRYHGLTALETQRAPKSLAKEGTPGRGQADAPNLCGDGRAERQRLLSSRVLPMSQPAVRPSAAAN